MNIEEPKIYDPKEMVPNPYRPGMEVSREDLAFINEEREKMKKEGTLNPVHTLVTGTGGALIDKSNLKDERNQDGGLENN